MTTKEPECCPECRAFNGRHAINCSLITFEDAKVQLANYHKEWLKLKTHLDTYKAAADGATRDNVIRNKQHATYWQGKFQAVKTENNALRKANQRLLNRLAELEGALSGAGILTGDDAEYFLQRMESVIPIDPEKAKQAREHYELFKRIYVEKP